MNPEVKEKFVAALKSGKYKQGREALRRGDQFCCIGVLCDLKNPDDWIDPKADVVEYRDANVYSYFQSGRTGSPPMGVMRWAGITERQVSDLIEMNDEGDASFEQIAAHVEWSL